MNYKKFTLKEIHGIKSILAYMFYASYRKDSKVILKDNEQKIELLFEKLHKIIKGTDWVKENPVLEDINIFDQEEKQIILQTIDCLNKEFPNPDHYFSYTGELEPQELKEIQRKLS